MAAALRAGCLGLVLLIAVLAAPVHALELSGEDFRDLARRAVDDPQARRQLLEVERVDGRPVDLRRTLRGAEGADLETRLRVMAEADPGPAVDADRARERAGEILSGRRFRGAELPRPFRGMLERVGERIDVLVERLARGIPGQEATLWTILAAAVVALAVFVALRIARRRTSAADRVGLERRRARREDPKDLERQAKEAEARGDLQEAVRLRFRAGLLLLDGVGAIAYRPSITTGEIRRALRQPDFARLAATFEEIVYGGRSASRRDVDEAKQGWPRVLERAGSTWEGS